MAYGDLRAFLNALEAQGELVKVPVAIGVDPLYMDHCCCSVPTWCRRISNGRGGHGALMEKFKRRS